MLLSRNERGFDTDILIIGGGPAGSSAGIESSKAGLKVLVVERKKQIGEPVRCAGYIPSLLLNEIGTRADFIIQSVDNMVSILPDGTRHVLRAPGYLIERSIFDRRLYETAVQNGAKYLLGARALEFVNGMVMVKKSDGNIIPIKAKVIIGADGPHSRVSSWMGIKDRSLVMAVQARVPLESSLNNTIIFLKKEYFGGYGWLFPRGDEANVGIGVKKTPLKRPNIYKLLTDLIHQLNKEGIIKNRIVNITAGWIPVRPLERFVSNNMMLVGDAAGHTHPITGAGIYQAVSGGRMAGLIASRAIKNNDLTLLMEYQREFMEIFYDSLKRADMKRELMESNWKDLNNIIKRCWIGFREYYHES